MDWRELSRSRGSLAIGQASASAHRRGASFWSAGAAHWCRVNGSSSWESSDPSIRVRPRSASTGRDVLVSLGRQSGKPGPHAMIRRLDTSNAPLEGGAANEVSGAAQLLAHGRRTARVHTGASSSRRISSCGMAAVLVRCLDASPRQPRCSDGVLLLSARGARKLCGICVVRWSAGNGSRHCSPGRSEVSTTRSNAAPVLRRHRLRGARLLSRQCGLAKRRRSDGSGCSDARVVRRQAGRP